MSKFVVCETIRQYHEVDIDDELVINVLVNQANRLLDKFDSGAEALEYILKLYQERYGFDYNEKYRNLPFVGVLDLKKVKK